MINERNNELELWLMLITRYKYPSIFKDDGNIYCYIFFFYITGSKKLNTLLYTIFCNN